ncbi:hypothetical protein AVBRAN12640_04610 [Campylobacter sp. RM12640]|uniref:hypothetical protein n=1 Tax=unclassified Campylobacter TaxID=2593542 RepID=UPI001BDA52F4|nr:hypothetical protein [Campylobacter sp. 2018MI01]MBT0879525.1 hypothetical protein [Campylobacter sp. 2018MI01]MBZ7981815.1 hypothetical protein [Campylobacter sp. RM12640]MBZ7989812.1 hypothetical protein [Campylobacter sp. RM12635]
MLINDRIVLSSFTKTNNLNDNKKASFEEALQAQSKAASNINDELINKCISNAEDDFAWSMFGFCTYFPTEWHTPRKDKELDSEYLNRIPKEDLGVMMFLEACGEIETRKLDPIKNDLDEQFFKRAEEVLENYQITPDLELKIIEFAKKSSKEFMQKYDAPAGNIGLNHPKLQAIFNKHGISMDEFVDKEKLMQQSFKFDFDKEKDKLLDELMKISDNSKARLGIS